MTRYREVTLEYIKSPEWRKEVQAAIKRVIKYLFWHCSAGPQNQAIPVIEGYWKSLGWQKPGYSFILLPNGNVAQLIDLSIITNGVAGYNANGLHSCYLGGVQSLTNDPMHAKGTPIDNRTEHQKETMQVMTEILNELFPIAIIMGHRDVSPDKDRDGIIEPHEWIKACPSFSVKEWLSQIGFKTATPVKMLETRTSVNIRSGPGIKFETIAPPLKRGEKVKRIAEAEGWVYVEYHTLKGWMMSGYLT